MKIMTPAEVARRTGVTTETVRRWDREGRLRAFRTESGRRLFDEKAVEALIERRRQRERAKTL
jgi:excisionase family DNA binding protein